MRIAEIIKKPFVAAAMGLAALLALPHALDPTLSMKLLEMGLFGCSVNLLLGRAKLLSFGHAAFFGAGSYGAAYVVTALGATPELALLAGLGIGALLGAAFGAVAIQRQGIYFSMVTLALAQMLYFGFVKAPFTNGEDGIQGVARGKLFGLVSVESDMALYYTIAAVSAAAFWFIWRVSKSPYGKTLQALGEHEARAASFGVPAARMKHIAFTLSASLVGLAGAMNVLIFQMANLGAASWHTSGEAVLMSLLGGIGSVFGPILGAAVIMSIETGLAERAGALVPVCMGVMFMLATLAFRKGIAGAWDGAKKRVATAVKSRLG